MKSTPCRRGREQRGREQGRKTTHKEEPLRWMGFLTCRRPLGGFPQGTDWRQVALGLLYETLRVACFSVGGVQSTEQGSKGAIAHNSTRLYLNLIFWYKGLPSLSPLPPAPCLFSEVVDLIGRPQSHTPPQISQGTIVI